MKVEITTMMYGVNIVVALVNMYAAEDKIPWIIAGIAWTCALIESLKK